MPRFISPLRPPHQLTLSALMCLLWVAATFAAETAHDETLASPAPIPVLSPVLVEAERITPTTGTTILDREMIENLPSRNGSVNELIGTVPGVQYGESVADSFTAGEITPPNVSISGSRFYDNNYTIDGIGNNNPLDPAGDGLADVNKLPGYPQTHFLNPRLINQITVYSSNIPAEFGGFTGGQVDVETISPHHDPGGRISFRTTSDNWTRFHIRPAEREDFHTSDSVDRQPHFDKYDFGLTFNMPLSADTAVIASYQQLYSRIPLHYLEGKTVQTRRHENLLVKLEHHLPDASRLLLTGLYSPTRAAQFLSSFKDSHYELEDNDYSLLAKWEKDFNSGMLNFSFGYTDQETSRRSDENDRYRWDPATASIDWTAGMEGGLGPLKTDSDKISVKADYSFFALQAGQTGHRVKFGLEYNRSRQSYHRPLTTYYYYSAVVDPALVCLAGDSACIAGEQFLSRRTVYQAADSSVELEDYALFLQDSIVWKRLELFPGVRLSYNDFSDNLDIAPRFSTSVDIFGNRSTILFAGLNRYYSGTLLTHALYSSIVTQNQYRPAADSEWTGSATYLYHPGDLKTPYVDEQTVGIIQNLFGGELKLQYIHKEGRDEFARSRINNPAPEPDLYHLNNNGRSQHESALVSWHRSWKKHAIEINGTWQRTTTSNSDYDSIYAAEDMFETVWYKGEELYPYEIPRKDFNRPYIVNLIYSCELPYGIRFTNTTKFRGAYWGLQIARDENGLIVRRQSVIQPEQGEVYVYEKVKSHDSVTFDWHFSRRLPSRTKSNATLSLDILNVFDKRSKIGYHADASDYVYELGRQIWAGLEFSF